MAIRVIQWATGSIGRVTLRHVIDSVDLELVGLKVHSAGKVGRDAGDIVGRPRTGVVATDQVDEIVAIDADVVLHVPLNGQSPHQHLDDIERLLRSGKNVITTVGFTYPWAIDPRVAERLDDAARTGGATLFGTGMNPGFLSERLAVAVTTLCTNVTSLSVQELYDCTPVASPEFVFDLAGFGRSVEEFWRGAAGRAEFFAALFGETMGFLIDTLQLPVDRIEPEHDVMIAADDIALAAGTVPAGTVAGVRWQFHARKGDRTVITVRAIWRCGPPAPGWEGDDGWQVRIEGAPRIELDLRWLDPIGLPERSKAVQFATAGPVVRAIGEVVAAPPGILVPPAFAAFRGPGSGVPDVVRLIRAQGGPGSAQPAGEAAGSAGGTSGWVDASGGTDACGAAGG